MIKIEEAQKNNELFDKFLQENSGLIGVTIKRLNLIWKEDYLQEGYVGLIKATKRFKPEFGTEFSTYAVSVIAGQIMRYRRDYETTDITGANISRNIKDIFFKSQKLQRTGMSDSEICQKLNINTQKLNNARKAMTPCLSMDASIDSDEDNENMCLHAIIPDNTNIEDDVIENVCTSDLIMRLYQELTAIQTKVLTLHFEGLSQEHIGKIVGLSQVQVGRILKKIIDKGKRIAG
jgi:RNA polymerase sporulation-specific sigma factor